MPQENEIPQQADVSFTQLFNQALSLQQQQKWDLALEAYQTLITKNINDLSVFQAAAVYHNMSTVAYEKADFLKAYIWSKKSLALNPSSLPAKESFEQYSKKIEIPHVSHHLSNYESFKGLISTVSIDAWLVFSLIFVFATFWFFIKNIITTKKNKLANNFTRPAKWPVYTLLLTTIAVLSMAYIRYLDHSTVKALVIADKAQVQTAPGENKSVIFEAPAGLELEVLNFDQGYYLIRYPGAFSGWVKGAQLEMLSLNFKQSQ